MVKIMENFDKETIKEDKEIFANLLGTFFIENY